MKKVLLICGFFGLVALLFSQTTPGWKMSDEQLKALANQVSAGRSLQPGVWPNGARVAVLLSFDVDSQTWELRKGETPSIVALSQGEYGTRVGLNRIVALMDKHQIPAGAGPGQPGGGADFGNFFGLLRDEHRRAEK